MKPFCLICAAAFAFLASPASAKDDPDAVLSGNYAVCVGRASAVVEHMWLTQDARADALQFRHDWLRALYDATRLGQPNESLRGREVHMMDRIRAKRDQKALLQASHFSDNPRRARLAETRAMGQLFTCHQLINR